MSFFDNPDYVRSLQNLLNPNNGQEDSDIEDEDDAVAPNNMTPGSIGQAPPGKQKQKKPKPSVYDPLPQEKPPQTFEEWQERQEKENDDVLESRKCPEYKMTYRQAVGTEDVFFQMNNRTNASASCEDLIVEISLPGESTPSDKMQLSITETEVDLGTPIYRLKLPLVHKVDVDRCKAKYDTELCKMFLTLRLKRELDFVNF